MQITESTVALITGGGSGLGEATARRLHADGACVVLLDLDRSPGADVAASLDERARLVAADVRNEDHVQGAIDAAREMGELRITVNCAGIGTPGRIVGKRGVHSLDDYKAVIEINLIGTFNVLRLSAAAMLENDPVDGERGIITMTASVAAYDGQIGQAAYASSKGGIVGLTLSAARDLAKQQIRVMTVAPGTFETPMLAGLPQEGIEALEAQIPHPSRLGKPAEYAALVAHIVDNPMLNGEVIRLDGALRMPPR